MSEALEHKDEPDKLGGDPHRILADIKMGSRAVREGWEVPDDVKKTLPKFAAELATKEGFEKHGRRTWEVAANMLVNMSKINQADRHLDEKYRRIDEGKATDQTALKLYAKEAPTEEV